MILPVDPARFAAYLAVMSAMCFFPGPANLFSVATGLTRGRAAMLAGVAGMNLANLTWYVLAALGLGALTRTVPGVFHLLRIGGAAYLLWLAHEAWKGRHAPIEGPADGPAPAPRRRSAFRDGFVVQITNPKALLFFTAVLPPFLEAARRLKAQRPNLHVLVAAAATVADRVREQVGAEFAVIEGQADKLSAMKAATVALACSGTVTTELALAGCPMVVGYRIGAVSYAILKRLVSTRWITLMNIAAQAGVVPELIQADCTPEALAREAGRFLDDRDLREDQIAAQAAALETMGRDLSSDPDAAAAEAVLAVIRRASPRPG